MNYELKNKITITKELLNDLETKSWQEIEYLQTQIANLAEDPVNYKLKTLFKNLLTSYYVFAGGVETLASAPDAEITIFNEPASKAQEDQVPAIEPIDDIIPEDTNTIDDSAVSEPFEYFVDFDEPVGAPISDEDLYGR